MKVLGIDWADVGKNAMGALHLAGGVVLNAFGAGQAAQSLEQLEAGAGILPDWAMHAQQQSNAAVVNAPDAVTFIAKDGKTVTLSTVQVVAVTGGRRIAGNGYKPGDPPGRFSFGYESPDKFELQQRDGSRVAGSAARILFMGGSDGKSSVVGGPMGEADWSAGDIVANIFSGGIYGAYKMATDKNPQGGGGSGGANDVVRDPTKTVSYQAALARYRAAQQRLATSKSWQPAAAIPISTSKFPQGSIDMSTDLSVLGETIVGEAGDDWSPEDEIPGWTEITGDYGDGYEGCAFILGIDALGAVPKSKAPIKAKAAPRGPLLKKLTAGKSTKKSPHKLALARAQAVAKRALSAGTKAGARAAQYHPAQHGSIIPLAPHVLGDEVGYGRFAALGERAGRDDGFQGPPIVLGANQPLTAKQQRAVQRHAQAVANHAAAAKNAAAKAATAIRASHDLADTAKRAKPYIDRLLKPQSALVLGYGRFAALGVPAGHEGGTRADLLGYVGFPEIAGDGPNAGHSGGFEKKIADLLGYGRFAALGVPAGHEGGLRADLLGYGRFAALGYGRFAALGRQAGREGDFEQKMIEGLDPLSQQDPADPEETYEGTPVSLSPARPAALRRAIGQLDETWWYDEIGDAGAGAGMAEPGAGPVPVPDPNNPGYLTDGTADPTYTGAGTVDTSQDVPLPVRGAPLPADQAQNQAWQHVPDNGIVYDLSKGNPNFGSSPMPPENAFGSANAFYTGDTKHTYRIYRGLWHYFNGDDSDEASEGSLKNLNAVSMRRNWGPLIGNPNDPNYAGLQFAQADGVFFWQSDNAPVWATYEADSKITELNKKTEATLAATAAADAARQAQEAAQAAESQAKQDAANALAQSAADTQSQIMQQQAADQQAQLDLQNQKYQQDAAAQQAKLDFQEQALAQRAASADVDAGAPYGEGLADEGGMTTDDTTNRRGGIDESDRSNTDDAGEAGFESAEVSDWQQSNDEAAVVDQA